MSRQASPHFPTSRVGNAFPRFQAVRRCPDSRRVPPRSCLVTITVTRGKECRCGGSLTSLVFGGSAMNRLLLFGIVGFLAIVIGLVMLGDSPAIACHWGGWGGCWGGGC